MGWFGVPAARAASAKMAGSNHPKELSTIVLP
jgi:hypothetical protein